MRVVFAVALLFVFCLTLQLAAAENPLNLPVGDRGELPKGEDGQPLNTDFENGTLDDWTVEGEAFTPLRSEPNHGQPTAWRPSAHAAVDRQPHQLDRGFYPELLAHDGRGVGDSLVGRLHQPGDLGIQLLRCGKLTHCIRRYQRGLYRL